MCPVCDAIGRFQNLLSVQHSLQHLESTGSLPLSVLHTRDNRWQTKQNTNFIKYLIVKECLDPQSSNFVNRNTIGSIRPYMSLKVYTIGYETTVSFHFVFIKS